MLSFAIGAVLIIGIGAYVFLDARAADMPQENVAGIPALAEGAGENPAQDVPANSESASTATPTGGTQSPTAPSGGGSPVSPGTQATPAPSGITSADVAKHGTRESCWSIVNGSVYDLTSWIPNHPGGEGAILRMCGTDGSAGFNRQHGGAAKQATILAGFKIGTLAQ
jgi:hypothetical protein